MHLLENIDTDTHTHTRYWRYEAVCIVVKDNKKTITMKTRFTYPLVVVLTCLSRLFHLALCVYVNVVEEDSTLVMNVLVYSFFVVVVRNTNRFQLTRHYAALFLYHTFICCCYLSIKTPTTTSFYTIASV